MAITAGEFITKMASMAGISSSDPDLVNILSNSDFTNYKLPEQFYSRLNSGILTPESARNNENLRKHFHAEILNGLDSNLESTIERYGIESDIAESIRSEKKTTEKYNKLIEKLNDVYSRKAQTSSKSDKKEYEEEIAKLNGQIKELSEAVKKAPTERDQYWTDKLKGKAVQNLLSNYKYAGEDNLPKDVLIETAQILLNRKLNEQKIRVEYNPENDNIGLKTESGMDFYKENSPISFKDFADSVLAENKLLDLGGSKATTTAASAPSAPKQTIINGAGKTIDASKFYAALDDIASGR
jgi:hypothetical protein